MLKLNKAVSRAVNDVIAIHELRNVLKADVYENSFGEYATEVKIFNTTMGVASCIQLALDIKNKRDIKRIVGNQVVGAVIVLGHNAYHTPSVRDSVKAYFKK